MSEQNKKNKEYWIENANMEWHKRQFQKPYRITEAFEEFLAENIEMSGSSVLDIGCGSGAALSYIAKKHPETYFTGVDINEELLSLYTQCVWGGV